MMFLSTNFYSTPSFTVKGLLGINMHEILAKKANKDQQLLQNLKRQQLGPVCKYCGGSGGWHAPGCSR